MSSPEVSPLASTKRPLALSSIGGEDVTSNDHDPLPYGRFLSIGQLVRTLRSAESMNHLVRKTVPSGPKNNVFFLVKSELNADTGRKEYFDDCGAWDSKKGSTVNNFMIFDKTGKTRTIYMKKDLYCAERRVKRKQIWVPLSPQPTQEEVIKIHRYYATLKDNDNYKKRVTTISGVDFPEVALIEYCGTYTTANTMHGNAKRKKTAYVRTDPKTLNKIRDQVKHKSPSIVYLELSEENSFEVPRDKAQVRSVKYTLNKKLRLQDMKKNREEVLGVLSALETNPSVRQVIHSKGKSPCVILYTDSQLEDMKQNLSSGSLLGVDGTLNLNGCYLTTTVYVNSSVQLIEPTSNPLFLGPMYLHWDTEFETYHSFFSHLQCKFFDCVRNIELKLGGDQELLMTRALKSCFPGSTIIISSKHLSDNISSYLCDKAGCPSSERTVIADRIFGENGLIKSKDLFTFGTKMLELLPFIEQYPLFLPYFEKLKPVLFSYVCEPYQKVMGETLWTKNYSESFEAFLRLSANCNTQKFPDLVEKLCDVITSQAAHYLHVV